MCVEENSNGAVSRRQIFIIKKQYILVSCIIIDFYITSVSLIYIYIYIYIYISTSKFIDLSLSITTLFFLLNQEFT